MLPVPLFAERGLDDITRRRGRRRDGFERLHFPMARWRRMRGWRGASGRTHSRSRGT